MAHENRLARESSPYLLQHARNPVDWRPWGEEAFAEARRRDVPILLSVGYSTCYWCHVMERESFESEALAQILNERYVAIKVDREERPDVDEVYMASLLITRGSGGWPMNVFLEPERLRPFFAGTYFPPEDRPGVPGFARVLETMSRAWQTQRTEVLAQAQAVADAVAEHLASAQPESALDSAPVTNAVASLLRMFDRQHGGFGSAPKFPQPVYPELLLAVRTRAGDDATGDAIDEAVRRTLNRMAIGGLFDQLAGGFHRYSVDGFWLVPHFEKMLYDQGLLAHLYAEAAALYNDPFFAKVTRRTLEYVCANLTDPAGGFWSAQDAEVDHREGLNYLWTAEEVRAALAHRPAADVDLALGALGLSHGPNFRDPHHPSEPARNVLYLAERPENLAREFALGREHGAEAFTQRLDELCAELLRVRDTRKQPHTDDKVIAAWNGLMIRGMARGALLLEDRAFYASASRAASFVLGTMRGASGELLRTWRRGVAGPLGVLEDSAAMALGLTQLARTARALAPEESSRWIGEASALIERARGAFWSGEASRWSDTRPGQSQLFVRTSSTHDGAVPSGPGMMAHALLDLAELTGDERWAEWAGRTLRGLSGQIRANPVSLSNAVRATFRALTMGGGAAEIITRPGEHAAPEPTERPADFQPVEIYADTERLTLNEGEPAELRLFVRIAPGYHVAAATGAPGLVPFRVSVHNGAGVQAFADYPPGVPYGVMGHEVQVYAGEFELRVALERAGAWSGTPLLLVTCQACSDRECLPPTRLELDVALDRGRDGGLDGAALGEG
ncbi:MAG: DUF255 domain-containing protein [Planctomycetota bacterium]|nr:DUF255 domain-containing protein [Planctomycetota bacterium]